jgi:phosphoglycerate dehydrogenase-like enzyme
MSDAPVVVIYFPFAQAELEMLRSAVGPGELVVCDDYEHFLAELPRAEVVCAFRLPRDFLQRARRLCWLQNPGAGVDHLAALGILDPQLPLLVTNVSGIHAVPISEYVFASMLNFARRWPRMFALQERHEWPQGERWEELRGEELYEHTLAVIGLGSIGRRLAQLGKAFGMYVLGIRHDPPSDPASDPHAHEVYGPDHLIDVLHRADYVVISVPLTAETRGMIGERELRAMRPHAYLVNIARGQIIDEAALIRALTEGWIAGVGLDVVVQEPLPADSPLYNLPNVILTPHISGVTGRYSERVARIFAENLRRYRAGEDLTHLVNKTRGY